MSVKVPGAVRPLIGFPVLLRQHGFTIAPEQIVSFLQKILQEVFHSGEVAHS